MCLRLRLRQHQQLDITLSAPLGSHILAMHPACAPLPCCLSGMHAQYVLSFEFRYCMQSAKLRVDGQHARVAVRVDLLPTIPHDRAAPPVCAAVELGCLLGKNVLGRCGGSNFWLGAGFACVCAREVKQNTNQYHCARVATGELLP